MSAVETVQRRQDVAATAVNLKYRTAHIFPVTCTTNIASISTNLPLSCVCRLVLMLGSPIETFLPEYSGASLCAFSIVRCGYCKPVLTSFPRQHTRVTLLSFERRTRENRCTDLRKIASRRHQYALTTRPPQVSKQRFSSDRDVAKHSAAEKYYRT